MMWIAAIIIGVLGVLLALGLCKAAGRYDHDIEAIFQRTREKERAVQPDD